MKYGFPQDQPLGWDKVGSGPPEKYCKWVPRLLSTCSIDKTDWGAEGFPHPEKTAHPSRPCIPLLAFAASNMVPVADEGCSSIPHSHMNVAYVDKL